MSGIEIIAILLWVGVSSTTMLMIIYDYLKSQKELQDLKENQHTLKQKISELSYIRQDLDKENRRLVRAMNLQTDKILHLEAKLSGDKS